MTTVHLRWDGEIIAESVFVAFIGSYACITLYEQYRYSSYDIYQALYDFHSLRRICVRTNQSKLATPIALLVLMALSLGGGVHCF